MAYNVERAYVDELLLKKQMKILTSEEQQELNHILERDPEAVIQDKYYQRRANQVISTSEKEGNDNQWEDISAEINKRRFVKNRTRAIRVTGIAAAIAVLVLSAFLFKKQFWNKEPRSLSENNSKTFSEKTITLKTSDGKKIPILPSVKNEIKSGSKVFQIDTAMGNFSNSDGALSGINILQVPAGKDYTLVLSDGSTVRLNAATEIEFPFVFAGPTREVTIKGEGYFSIKKDPLHPFIVHTSLSDIQVLGTEFNVNTYSSGIVKTALVKGSVQITSHNRIVKLLPGNQATVSLATIKNQNFDPRFTLGWLNGKYYFHNTPVTEIAAMMERWFDVEVRIDNAVPKSETFTGSMNKNLPLDAFLQSMEGLTDITFKQEKGIIVISK